MKLGEEEGERDSIDDPFLMDLDNRHTKSELSIPYMDASLPPTPKVKMPSQLEVAPQRAFISVLDGWSVDYLEIYSSFLC